MSLAHLKLALKCHRFRGNAKLLLVSLCYRAGTGKPMANGHTIPFGQVQASDKQLGRDIEVYRRETIRQLRKKLTAAGVITWELVGNTCNGRNTYPVHLYEVNRERLTELCAAKTAAHKPKKRHTKSAAHKAHGKCGIQKGLYAAKSAAQAQVFSSGANDTRQTEVEKPDGVGVSVVVPPLHAASDSGSGAVAPDADTDAATRFAGEEQEPPPGASGQGIPDSEMEVIRLAVGLEKEWVSLFPTKASDPEHFWQLLSRAVAPEKLFQVIHWFPVSNWTLKINSTEGFMMAFKNGILPSFENYHAKVEETSTHAHAADWVEKCRMARIERAEYERWTPEVLGPPRTCDAREEESWNTADDLIVMGLMDDADTDFDPWAGERDASEYYPEALFDPDSVACCEDCGKPCETISSPCNACDAKQRETELADLHEI